MRGWGSGENGEWQFLDYIALISFFISLQNLDLNITQEDMQKVMNDIDKKTELLLAEIHGHLENQDALLKKILERLEQNDS